MTTIDTRIRNVFLLAAALAALGAFPDRASAQPEGKKPEQKALLPKLTAQQQAQLQVSLAQSEATPDSHLRELLVPGPSSSKVAGGKNRT